MVETALDGTKAGVATSRGGNGRVYRGLSKAQRRDVRWMLLQSGGTHGVDVHGVWIKFRQEAEWPPKKPSRQTGGGQASNNSTQRTQRDAANAVSKSRVVTYGKAMCFLKGLVLRRWKEAMALGRREREQQRQYAETEAAAAAAAAATAANNISARIALEERVTALEAKLSESMRMCEAEQEMSSKLRKAAAHWKEQSMKRQAELEQQSQQLQYLSNASQQQIISGGMAGEDMSSQKRAHESPARGTALPAGEASPLASGPARGAAASTPPIAPKKPRALAFCGRGASDPGGSGADSHSSGHAD